MVCFGVPGPALVTRSLPLASHFFHRHPLGEQVFLKNLGEFFHQHPLGNKDFLKITTAMADVPSPEGAEGAV